MSDDPICEACGHPRSNHPYRHPFVGPSRDDTIKQQADRIEELEAKLTEVEKDAKRADAIWSDNYEALKAKLAKALTALSDVQRFVKDLEPYADQGHTLVPALQKACAVYVELTGGKDAE